MIKREIDFELEGKDYQGFLVYDETINYERPGILIAHAWRGQDDFAKQKAFEYAEKGYIAFAGDVYGKKILAKNKQEAESLMLPLFLNRDELQKRIKKNLEILEEQEKISKHRTAAIGFCFGGLTVIELMRSGAKLAGIASVHGVLGNSMGDQKAHRPSNALKLYGEALFLHGHLDPLVSKEDIDLLQEELDHAKVRWQFHTFGDAYHAFTVPEANDDNMGLHYNSRAANTSRKLIDDYLQSIFQRN
ncbi:MAG: dienelactone hydrolase family protein [Chlamydiales bacterium]